MSSNGDPDYLDDDEDDEVGGLLHHQGLSERLEYRRARPDPQEKERFYSRLSTIPNVRTLPSIGDWILLQVQRPADVARKVNRRLAPGVVSVPRHVPGTVRLHVSDPKSNELLFRTIREVVA